MKKALEGIIFWTIAIAFILLMVLIAETLAKLMSIDMIMTVVYIALGYSFIFILKN